MQTQTMTPTFEAELRRITTDGSPGKYPSTAVVGGRAVLMHAYGRWVGVTSPVPLADLGTAAKRLEFQGLDWRQYSSPQIVVQAAETARSLANHPLVTEYKLPIAWLMGGCGQELGQGWLEFIALAIELAEKLDEDWTKWPDTVTAVQVITEILPRLQALVEAKVVTKVEAPAPMVEAKTERKPFPKGVRKAIARAKSQGNWDVVRRLGGIIPTHVLEARAEAAKAKATLATQPPPPAPEPEPELIPAPQPSEPGELSKVDGIVYVVCNGRYGNCLATVQLATARLPKSLGWIKNHLRLKGIKDMTKKQLAKVAFCEDCAKFSLTHGSQTYKEACEARDQRIAENEAYWAAQRETNTGAEKPSRWTGDKARRAKNGGAFGNPSNPRPASYLARKAQKAAKSRAEMHKGATSGGGQKGSKGKKK